MRRGAHLLPNRATTSATTLNAPRFMNSIRAEIEDRVTHPERRRPGHRGHDITQLRNTTVREQALHIDLMERGEITDHHRETGGRPNRPNQRFVSCRREHAVEEACENGQRRGLGDDAHEGGCGQRCTFEHVGHPHVERHETDLERNADHEQTATHGEERIGSRERLAAQPDSRNRSLRTSSAMP